MGLTANSPLDSVEPEGLEKRLLDLPLHRWPAWFEARGGRGFHGKIAARWVLQEGVADWRTMTDLPLAMRERFVDQEPLMRSRLEAVSAAGDHAVKVLLRFPDGASVEAVGMPGTRGRTLCISTQVGCPVGCTFCASGIGGLERNLSAGDILEQVLYLRQKQGPFHRLVIMGMGDAGLNLRPTLQALDVLIDSGFSARRITLSTVAPPGSLKKIAAWGRPVNLALSIHAPNDDLRHELIPGVRACKLEGTLQEADELFARTGREYTVEYVLLEGINDSEEQAEGLGNLLQGRRCHVNLIPYNPVSDLGYQRPSLEVQERFAQSLRRLELSVTLRLSFGREVDAACGQLRRRHAGPIH